LKTGESVLNLDSGFKTDLLGKNKLKLFRDLGKIHSFSVCNVIKKINSTASEIEEEKK
jgi:hypothetical protein